MPPGTNTFHLTFLSGPNSMGGFWSSATPDPLGPRNCGQASGLSAPSPAAATTATATDAIDPFISSPSVDWQIAEAICLRRRNGLAHRIGTVFAGGGGVLQETWELN